MKPAFQGVPLLDVNRGRIADPNGQVPGVSGDSLQ